MGVCIIYDTKRKDGATSHIAKWMQDVLIDSKVQVDLKLVNEIDNFDYDLFVVGSPIYWEKPMRSIVNFLSENQEKLDGKKVAIFVVCLANLFGHFTAGHVKNHYLKPLEEKVSGSLVESGIFKGGLKKPDYNERKKVIGWIKEIIADAQI